MSQTHDKRRRTDLDLFVLALIESGLSTPYDLQNPARLVRQRPEGQGRVRFYSYDEYDKLFDVIRRRFPEHEAEFVASVQTGMRLTEQYTTEWPQVHLDRRAIELSKTKNGSARTVRLNADAIVALESVRPPGKRPRGRVFPRQTGETGGFDNRSWLNPCMEEAGIENAS